MPEARVLLMSFCVAAALLPASAQNPKGVDIDIVGRILKPRRVDATPDAMRRLTAPAGFEIHRFATGLGKPRMIAVAEDGAVYVTRREPGDCLLLRDTDGDGKADQQTVVAKKEGLHGIALHGNRAYFATVKEVFVADRRPDGSFAELRQIAVDLPDGGQHANRTIGVGPDGMLYVSVGSSCNACTETNKESATLLRMKPDGSGREVFASGLRNTIGFGWHPETRALWGLDHGIDWLGDNQQGEELNLLEQGAKYGWPYVYGKGGFNLQDDPPGGVTHAAWAKQSREPALLYTAHSAPMQMVFYTGSQFPAEYRNDAFAAMRGSWNRKPPSGYEVVRIRFSAGKPVGIEPFVKGFLMQQGKEWSILGRPVGLAVAQDGSLLIGDDTNGVIYRVSKTGAGEDQSASRTRR